MVVCQLFDKATRLGPLSFEPGFARQRRARTIAKGKRAIATNPSPGIISRREQTCDNSSNQTMIPLYDLPPSLRSGVSLVRGGKGLDLMFDLLTHIALMDWLANRRV